MRLGNGLTWRQWYVAEAGFKLKPKGSISCSIFQALYYSEWVNRMHPGFLRQLAGK